MARRLKIITADILAALSSSAVAWWCVPVIAGGKYQWRAPNGLISSILRQLIAGMALPPWKRDLFWRMYALHRAGGPIFNVAASESNRRACGAHCGWHAPMVLLAIK